MLFKSQDGALFAIPEKKKSQFLFSISSSFCSPGLETLLASNKTVVKGRVMPQLPWIRVSVKEHTTPLTHSYLHREDCITGSSLFQPMLPGSFVYRENCVWDLQNPTEYFLVSSLADFLTHGILVFKTWV